MSSVSQYLKCPPRPLRYAKRLLSTSYEPRFIPSRLDEIEPVEEYRPGGLYPMSIGDRFANGRYKVIHKLGYGGFSTVWLAQDVKTQTDGLVALKAMRADTSSKPAHELPELSIPRALQDACPDFHRYFQPVKDHFLVRGPNGVHRFLISPLGGLSILALSDSPGRTSGSRRLRGDLARRVAKHTAQAIHCMHRAGFVHGDLTTSNILFRVSEKVRNWSDADLYNYVGPPETEEIWTRDGQPRGPHAPENLVASIENSSWTTHTSLLREEVVLIDFGQSYPVDNQPSDYEPGTAINYLSPEARFEERVGRESDVWALGCALFEIRAGFPLFDPFFGGDTDILRQTVETLGRFPDPWWGSFVERTEWFEEGGEPKSGEAQQRAGVYIQATRTSIREKLRSIGINYDPPHFDEGPLVEKPGVALHEEEVEVFGDLLEKMLRYRPEERIEKDEVVQHPWFARGSKK
ncbi:kinase-like domain-containing protein [Mycena crocata]|nr:kinase-like domain-containing protein [Mycena crocata]